MRKFRAGKFKFFLIHFLQDFPAQKVIQSVYCVVMYEFYYLHIFYILKQYTHLCTSVYKIHRFWHTWDLRKNCKQCKIQKLTDLCLMKCSSKTLQNLPYTTWNKKLWNIQIHRFILYFMILHVCCSLINVLVYVEGEKK